MGGALTCTEKTLVSDRGNSAIPAPIISNDPVLKHRCRARVSSSGRAGSAPMRASVSVAAVKNARLFV